MLPFHLIGHPIVHSPQLVRHNEKRERERYIDRGGGRGKKEREEREGGQERGGQGRLYKKAK